MSIVYPLDDSKLPGELIQLRKQCPEGMPILVGGSGLQNYSQTLSNIDAITIPTISGLIPELLKIRESRMIAPLDLKQAQ